MNVGFIGIGQMGRHMARRVLEGGHSLMVNDVNRAATAPLLEKGARWADTPKDIAKACEVVITSLPTPPIIEKVVYDKDGLKAGWKKGDIYIDMSTNSPATIRKIAGDAKKMGVVVLDAPVSGGIRGAEMGALAIMVGGDAAALEKVRKVLETMGQKIFPVGDVGNGNVAKLVNNMIALACGAADAEGFALGVKAGVDPKVLWEIISVSSGNNWSLQQYPNSVFKGNFEPGFRVSLASKDVGLALELGKDYKVSLPMGDAAQKYLKDVMASGMAEKDVTALIKLVEKKAGVKISPA